jgi:hypothetical protein
MRSSSFASAVLVPACLGLGGCMIYPWGDAIIAQALDYRLDRPRVLALNVYPPALFSGLPVELQALVLGPDGGEATDGTWKTCGLSALGPTSVWDLECFGQSEGVETIAQGLPTSWTPPSLGLDCDNFDTGFLDWFSCDDSVPFLLETEVDGQPVRGSFFGTIHETEGLVVPSSFRDVALTVTPGAVAGGEVEVEAWFGRPCSNATFRWYVDGGTLLDTARTAALGTRDWGVWSRNRWTLPSGPGPFRVVVVISAYDSWGCELKLETFGSDVANMTWAIATVSQP